jgi:hypothetical protein
MGGNLLISSQYLVLNFLCQKLLVIQKGGIQKGAIQKGVIPIRITQIAEKIKDT